MKSKPKFRSVSLSADLVGEIENYIQKSKRYRSIADFVSESSRLRLEQLENSMKETAKKNG